MRTPIMSCCRLMAVALFLFCSMPLFAQRQDILLNDNWKFRFSHQVQKGSEIRVDLPHTWNTQDALSGKIDYKRGIGNYEKKLFIRPEWQGKRLFLRFEGANRIRLPLSFRLKIPVVMVRLGRKQKRHAKARGVAGGCLPSVKCSWYSAWEGRLPTSKTKVSVVRLLGLGADSRRLALCTGH